MAGSFFSSLYENGNLRGSLLLSLSLQIFLILFAPLRKITVNGPILFLVWLAYLMADLVAIFGIGIVFNQIHMCACEVEVDRAIQAFWVSFLLLHLGGPDTITAFSSEDNLLWQRHLLSLICQVSFAIFVFMEIFPKDQSLVIPTILVFFVAILKNVERLMALYLSNSQLKESMHAQQGSSAFVDLLLVDELEAPEDGHCNDEEPKLDESIVVKHARYFFQIFKVFIGDLIFSSEERDMSRQYFQKVSAMDALRVISVELQFIYDVLHTKVLVLHSKLSCFFRFIAFTHIVLAFILFNRLKNDKIHALDVRITYSLLMGGIALDVLSLFMLILSDWTVAEFKLYNKGSSQQYSFLNNLVSAMDYLRKPRFATCSQPNATVTYKVLNTPLIFQRWSESISACNFFSEFLKESPRKTHKHNWSWGILVLCNICCFPIFMAMKIISCFQQAGGGTRVGGGGRGAFMHDRGLMITKMKYVSKNPFINKLWIYIFEEVRRKAKDANDLTKVKEIFDARGGMFLQSIAQEIDCGNLSAYVTGANYDSTILSWHIATEMWYNMDKQNMNSKARNEEREFSKILSDYMVYLLLNQPEVTSIVGGVVQMTSHETLFEMWMENGPIITNVERLCNKLFVVPTENSLTSPLGEGMKLAHEMERLREDKWKVMAGVWVEMLSYAAIHIKGNAHVVVLRKGGELLTFVWLLMVHFGCFYKPEWGISHERFHLDEQSS